MQFEFMSRSSIRHFIEMSQESMGQTTRSIWAAIYRCLDCGVDPGLSLN
jgi:hypothetical protein